MKFSSGVIFRIILLIYAIVTCVIAARLGGDFDIYLDAARKLDAHKNIYFITIDKGLYYYYSVFFALILVPFANNVFITELIWGIISYLFLYRTFQIIQSYFDFSTFSKRKYNTWVLLILFVSIQFIMYNVGMIQITFFLIWTMFESIELLSQQKNVLAGMLLGLVINIKIMPVLLLPYLFYRGYFKALSVAIVTFIALLFLPGMFIGYHYNQFLLSEWWHIINPGNKEHLFEAGIGSHSLVALLPVYLTETVGEMAFKRNILNLSHQHVELITNAVRLLLFSLSLFYLRTLPFKKITNKLKLFWELSFFMFVIPLLLPHQQKYSFLLTIPLVSYIIYFFIATYQFHKSFGYYVSLVTFTICMLFYSPFYGSDLMGTFLFDFTQHYRFLTFAALLIIPVSMYCSPNKLTKIKSK